MNGAPAQDLRRRLDRLQRYPLAALPTPLEPAPNFSSKLGVEVLIKRDDLTGLAMGGNKPRKLEYILADSLADGSDMLAGLLFGLRRLGLLTRVVGVCVAAPAAVVAPKTVEFMDTGASLLGLANPVYTGKALPALVEDVRQGVVRAGETVVYLHTGGDPLVYAYAEILASQVAHEPGRPVTTAS